MRLRYLHLQRFMSHEDTELEFPEAGLILITGDNGSGKSSIPEGVGTALWGKTLRGTPPWWEDGAGLAEVGTWEGYQVRRRRHASRSTVEISGGSEFESATKAQAELLRRVGPFEVWRRTSVFSSQDADSFTGASDGDRKRLLEALLGLDTFDPALKQCREDLRTEEVAYEALQASLRELEVGISGEQQRVHDAQHVLEVAGPAFDMDALRAEVDRLAKMLAASEVEIRAADRELQEVEHSLGGHQADLRTLQQQLRGLAGNKCDHCGQQIPEVLRSGIKSKVDAAVAAQQAARAAASARTAARRAQRDEVQGELVLIRAKHAAKQAQLIGAATSARSRASALRTQQEAREALRVLRTQRHDKVQQAMGRAAAVAELQAVERVLGLRGVRAHVLGRALGGVEALANTWLTKIAGAGVSLQLAPYTERKDGGVTDSIALTVDGMGGGYGYRGSSGGQRRAVDVALLFALAEVGQAAHGQGLGGTLFFDEVFDAVHSSRVAPLVAAMDEMAQTRLLIVISHNETLVRHLRPTVHLEVRDGVVRQVA